MSVRVMEIALEQIRSDGQEIQRHLSEAEQAVKRHKTALRANHKAQAEMERAIARMKGQQRPANARGSQPSYPKEGTKPRRILDAFDEMEEMGINTVIEK